MAQAGADAVVVYDVPLLAENGLAGGFDAVVVVEAPLETRLERLAGRGMDEQTARSRIAQQASDEQRRALATVVLDNGGSRDELIRQVDEAWPRAGRTRFGTARRHRLKFSIGAAAGSPAGYHADVAQLVAHNLAKVGVAGSNPVVRSVAEVW